MRMILRLRMRRGNIDRPKITTGSLPCAWRVVRIRGIGRVRKLEHVVRTGFVHRRSERWVIGRLRREIVQSRCVFRTADFKTEHAEGEDPHFLPPKKDHSKQVDFYLARDSNLPIIMGSN